MNPHGNQYHNYAPTNQEGHIPPHANYPYYPQQTDSQNPPQSQALYPTTQLQNHTQYPYQNQPHVPSPYYPPPHHHLPQQDQQHQHQLQSQYNLPYLPEYHHQTQQWGQQHVPQGVMQPQTKPELSPGILYSVLYHKGTTVYTSIVTPDYKEAKKKNDSISMNLAHALIEINIVQGKRDLLFIHQHGNYKTDNKLIVPIGAKGKVAAQGVPVYFTRYRVFYHDRGIQIGCTTVDFKEAWSSYQKIADGRYATALVAEMSDGSKLPIAYYMVDSVRCNNILELSLD